MGYFLNYIFPQSVIVWHSTTQSSIRSIFMDNLVINLIHNDCLDSILYMNGHKFLFLTDSVYYDYKGL